MSAIDQYSHKLLGTVSCPSSYELVYKSGWNGKEEQRIGIYRLLEDIPASESDFYGKKGDIILGGGSGEALAMRINPYKAFQFMTDRLEAGRHFEGLDAIFKAFWTMNTAFYFCEGYRKVGWDGKEQIEYWLTEHVLAFLQKNYLEDYKDVVGPNPLEKTGEICQLPTTEDPSLEKNNVI